MSTPTHHQPIPETQEKAAEFFKCLSAICSMTGTACAKRWGNANIDERARNSAGGLRTFNQSVLMDAGCVGCPAGKARYSLLNGLTKAEIAEVSREALSSAPPAVAAAEVACGEGSGDQRAINERSTSNQRTACADCGGLVTCTHDCPKGGYGVEASEEGDGAPSGSEEDPGDQSECLREECDVAHAEIDAIVAIVARTADARGSAQDVLHSIQGMPSIKANRVEIHTQLAESIEHCNTLDESWMRAMGQLAVLTEDLEDTRAILTEAYTYLDGDEGASRSAAEHLTGIMGASAPARSPEASATLEQLATAIHRAMLSADATHREEVERLMAGASTGELSRIRAERDEAQAQLDAAQDKIAEMEDQAEGLRLALLSIEQLSDQLDVARDERDEVAKSLEVSRALARNIEAQLLHTMARHLSLGGDNIEVNRAAVISAIDALTEKAARPQVVIEDQTDSVIIATDVLTRLFGGIKPEHGSPAPRAEDEDATGYASRLASAARRAVLAHYIPTEGSGSHAPAPRSAPGVALGAGEGSATEELIDALSSDLARAEDEVVRLAGENHLLKMRAGL